MVPPSQRPTYVRLSKPQEPWRKHDGFNTTEWLLSEPHALIWAELFQKMGLVPANLPTFPFFVFGPFLLVHEISNIGKDALDGELSRCRCALADPKTAQKANTHLQMLVRSLRRGDWLLKEAMKLATKEDSEKDAGAVMGDALEAFHQDPKKTPLGTLDEIEGFLRDPKNSRIVSITAVYLHLNKLRACQSPGTTRFLDDVQRVTLGEPWPSSSGSCDRLGAIDGGYCAAVPVDHPALNARAVLIALNFLYFERLKMVPANIDDCSSWIGSTELVSRRNKVLHKLRANGCSQLVPELLKCRFAVENWFPDAPHARTTAVIKDSGHIAQSYWTTLMAALPIPVPRSPSSESFTTNQELFVSQRSDLVVTPPLEPKTEEITKPENSEERKARKAEKNRRHKEANKQRRLAKRAASKATFPTSPEADTTVEVDATARHKTLAESEAPARFKASNVIGSGPPPRDDGKGGEKAKRKAKEQRRKERRRIKKEAGAEKKRLKDEAKARAREVQRLQDEEQKGKALENQRCEEELRRRQQENARALEQAAAREQSEKARREEIARAAEETQRTEEEEEICRAREAEAHRAREVGARGAEKARVAREETRRAKEVRCVEEARLAEEDHLVQEVETRHAQEARIVREDAACLAEQAHRAEIRRRKAIQRADEGRHTEQVNETHLAETAEARHSRETCGVTGTEETREQEAQLHRRQQTYLRRVEAEDRQQNALHKATKADPTQMTCSVKPILRHNIAIWNQLRGAQTTAASNRLLAADRNSNHNKTFRFMDNINPPKFM